MQLDRRQLTAFALLGVVMVLWAGNSIVGRAVAGEVPPLMLAQVRWAGASLIVLPFAIRPLRRDWRALVAAWKPVLTLGLLGVGAFNALLYSGLQFTTATNALLLQAAIPPMVMLLDRLLHGVTSTALDKLGVGFSVVGVAVIVFQGELAHLFSLRLGPGDVLVLLSVVVWALYTVWLRLRPKVSPVSFVAATFVIGTLAMVPFAAWEWSQGARIVWSGKALGAFAYVCVFPSIIAYFIYNHAAGTVGPARAGQAITLMPLFGAFMSAALLGERLHPYHFAGMALIVAGIVVSALAGRKPARR